MDTIYVYCPYSDSYGVTVIVDNLLKSIEDCGLKCKLITCLDSIPSSSLIIPYALDPSIELIKKGYNPYISYLTDACSLGYRNKLKFYIKHHNVFHYDFFYCLFWYFADYLLEKKVVRTYKNVVLVSNTDIDYLNRKYKASSNFICIPNGIHVRNVKAKSQSDHFRLGILSSWNHPTTAMENGWFINDYFARFIKKNPTIELVLAGRGEYINSYGNNQNVTIMGEIDDLDEFFSNIDIFIAPNPKGCGILNRLLDAFIYKTCVLGHKNAFSGFRYMKDAYLEFDDYDSFERQMEYLIGHKEILPSLIENAYSQVIEFNDWDKNMNAFVQEYLK